MDKYLITNINELTDTDLKKKLIDILDLVKQNITKAKVKAIISDMTIGTNFIDLKKLI